MGGALQGWCLGGRYENKKNSSPSSALRVSVLVLVPPINKLVWAVPHFLYYFAPGAAFRELISNIHKHPSRVGTTKTSRSTGNMSTLADELLQDFEDGSSGDEPLNDGLLDEIAEVPASLEGDDDEEPEDEEMVDTAVAIGPMDDPDEAQARVEKMELGLVKDIRSVASLMQKLEPVLKVSKCVTPIALRLRKQCLHPSLHFPALTGRALQKIERFRSQPQAVIGNIEDHPEYQLLNESNSLSTHIDGEIVLVHKFIRDHYSVRFPELERLIGNPLEYAKVVAILGNGPLDAESIKALETSTKNPLGVSLKSVLEGPTMMIVTMEATTSKGRAMNPEELERILRACEMVVSLDKAKTTLTEYVQSRMNIFAPNLTSLMGSLTAAQLLNAAGSLTRLCCTPSVNLASWGSKKQTAPGLATNVGIRQQGFIYHSPLIKSISGDLKRQAMRIVSNKVVLAARYDQSRGSPDGSFGEDLKNQCLERLDKLTRPAPNKGKRALPAPDDKPSRKRGGRRARKAKEATAMTDLRRAQNRMAFGKEEKEVGYGTGEGTAGLGMIGQNNDGKIRGLQIDQRTRAKLHQKHKGWGGATSMNGMSSSLKGFGAANSNISLHAKGLRTSGVGSTIGGAAGTQSSLAFTPVQGLELVDPKVREQLNRQREAEADRWFKGGTFTQVGDGPPRKKVDTGTNKMLPPPAPLKK